MKIAITGSTGLIGSALKKSLETDGHQAIGISRRGGGSEDSVRWDPMEQTIEKEKLEGVDGVVHLAGENIASGRWTSEQRRKIRDSRVEGTQFLSETLCGLESPPSVFVCASAIGYYGAREDELLDEEKPPGDDFLAEVCVEWEAACRPVREAGIRTVNTRIGIVLSPDGGALEKMLTPFKLGIGGRVGDGSQYMSWIAIDDAVRGLRHCLDNDALQGPVNLVAPNPVTNLEFTKTLGGVLNRPTILPVPSFILELVLGKMAAQALLLSSTRVIPKKLEESGFEFQNPDLEGALSRLLKHN
ncbi:MAG: TIGR01777 family protein [Candidatus Omnitrophica bacterium]|nr:TIGR01777 family protein [Candidatus Omnitrophota bacterium]